MGKRVIALLISIVLIASMCPVIYASGTLYKTKNDDVPVRNEPSSSYEPIKYLSQGTLITIVLTKKNSANNLWGQTKNGTWIYMGNLEPSSSSLPATGDYITNKSGVPLRNAPASNFPTIRTLNNNVLVQITDTFYNDAGNPWGVTSDNYYIYMGNLDKHTHKAVMCGPPSTYYTRLDANYHNKHYKTGDDLCSCGKVMVQGKETVTKEEHSFVNGTCTLCGEPEAHVHKAVMCGPPSTYYTGLDANYHNKHYKTGDDLCSCGKVMAQGKETVTKELHTFKSGICIYCGCEAPQIDISTMSQNAKDTYNMILRTNFNKKPLSEYGYSYELANKKNTGDDDKMTLALRNALITMLEGNDTYVYNSERKYWLNVADILVPYAGFFKTMYNEGVVKDRYISDAEDIDYLIMLFSNTDDERLKNAIASAINSEYSDALESITEGLQSLQSDATEEARNKIIEKIAGTVVKDSFESILNIIEVFKINENIKTDTAYNIVANEIIKKAIWQTYGGIITAGCENYNSYFPEESLLTEYKSYHYLWHLTDMQQLYAYDLIGTKWWSDTRMQSENSRVGAISSINNYPYSGVSAPVKSQSYKDVSISSNEFTAIDFLSKNNIMIGTAKDTFSPNSALTRAMMAMVLYNVAQQPNIGYLRNYSDVDQKDWYAKAVTWVSDEKIMTGYGNGRFGATDVLTREQMATLLYNYAKKEGYNVDSGYDLSIYQDSGVISNWAAESMRWALRNGLINEVSPGKIDPKGITTRAQGAYAVYIFITKLS